MEYLFQLMEEGEFEKCLRLSEQMLLRGGMTLVEMAKLNLVICRCRLGLHDSYGAVNSGLLAVKLARDLKEWDVLGRALLNVGTAYMGTRQYDLALQNFYGYLENVHMYSAARRFEGAIWRSIGVAHQRKLEPDRAVDALNRGYKWFAKQGADHSAFSCVHDLIHTYLQMRDANPDSSLDPVPDLLEKERQLARKYPADDFFQGIYQYDRAAHYLRCGRYARAMVCAMKALDVCRSDHQLTSNAHMILYECSRDLGDTKQALGYALAARVEAIRGRHYELEFLAAQAMADIIRKQGTEMIRELDLEYQAMGVDLGQYLSPVLLRRAN
ncbi:MAG TPA: hypothetical protein VNT75_19115 [Symbiobacteriaceae bacterium]|nr:hypothetical protein [Symbiobacteriaceae bacterium]